MERQTITVDIMPGGGQLQRLKMTQGDIGRPLGVYVMRGGVALDCSAYTANLYVLKADGNYYVTQATVDSTEMNLITWETGEQETPVAGDCAAQIRITLDDDDIGTARFVEYVEASPGFVGAESESEIESIMEYVREAAESASTATSAAATASSAAGTASSAAQSASSDAASAHTDAQTASQAAQTAEDVLESIPADYSQLSEDVTDLKSAIVEKAPAIYEEASGAIASFEDGADGMPIKSLIVGIDPVQDLHGYDNPWPAGGGKNIFFHEGNLTATKNGVTATFDSDSQTISITGTNTGTSAYVLLSISCTGDIPRETPLSKALIDAPSGVYVNFVYRKNNAWASVNNGDMIPAEIDAGIPINFQIGIYASAATLNVSGLHIQIERGSTAPTTYTPYSNICPITGHSAVTVTRTGVNIFDGVLERANINWTTYIFTPSPGGRWAAKNYIRVEPGIYYINHAANNVVTVYEDDSGNGGASASIDQTTHLFTVPAGKHYMKFGINESAEPTNICINYPATDTTYHAYQGQSIQIPLGQTVYGGTLAIHQDGSGELVVDRVNVDLGNYTYSRWNSSSARDVFSVSFNNIKSSTSLNEQINGISSVFAPTSYNATWNHWQFSYTNSDKQVAFIVPHNMFADASAFKEYVTGVQLVYPLATPVTYQLTYQQVLSTLLGANNIFADTGDVALEYPADTKMYIDQKITEAIANALNA